jgi:hypothetical protein
LRVERRFQADSFTQKAEFSSSANRGLFPMQPSVKRPRVYTYHEAVEEISAWYDAPEILERWRSAWMKAGWEPVVLGLETAAVHDRWEWYSGAIAQFPSVNAAGFDAACFHRWLAMAVVGGGFLADADVLPCSSGNKLWRPEPPRSLSDLVVHSVDFLEGKGACPCFVQGNALAYWAACEAFVRAGRESGARHLSDQALLRAGCLSFELRDDVPTVGAPGYSTAPAVHYKTDAIEAWSWTKSDWIAKALRETNTMPCVRRVTDDRADRLDVINRLDAEVRMLRTALATSEQDRADRLELIERLTAHIQLLQTEMEARNQPWRRWASRAWVLIHRLVTS